jgi:hypothetical protein
VPAMASFLRKREVPLLQVGYEALVKSPEAELEAHLHVPRARARSRRGELQEEVQGAGGHGRPDRRQEARQAEHGERGEVGARAARGPGQAEAGARQSSPGSRTRISRSGATRALGCSRLWRGRARPSCRGRRCGTSTCSKGA